MRQAPAIVVAALASACLGAAVAAGRIGASPRGVSLDYVVIRAQGRQLAALGVEPWHVWAAAGAILSVAACVLYLWRWRPPA